MHASATGERPDTGRGERGIAMPRHQPATQSTPESGTMSTKAIADWIYTRSPIWAQNWACTRHGRKLQRLRYNAEFYELLAWLEQSQWWSRDQLREYQEARLRHLIRHAFESVPYYRRLMDDRGLGPNDIQTIDDLGKLPILTKDIVRRNGDDMVSRAVRSRDTVSAHTGGTTGTGLTFRRSLSALHFQWAVWWRHRSRFGIELYQPHANFSGHSVVPLGQHSPPFWRENRAMKQTYVSLYHMTQANMPAYVDMLERRTFKYYSGFPSGLFLLADYLRTIDHKLARPPDLIITGAESLLPFQIEAFNEWIGAPVTEQYGLAEGCANISQCEQGNFHVDMEFAIVEPKPVGVAEEGRLCKVIGTSLHNYATPFIRYDTGDIATFSDESCPCGRKGDVVKYIDGRVESYLITPEGRRVGRMGNCFKDLINIRECQLVQHNPRELLVKVVKESGYTDADERHLITALRSRLGESLDLQIHYVERIPRTKSGKFRAVVSTIISPDLPGARQTAEYITAGAATRSDTQPTSRSQVPD